MITIRHSLSTDELAAAMPRLRESFARAGLDLDAMDVKFEHAEQGLPSFSEKIAELVLTHFPQSSELPNFKTTPWERANPNAPFWRKLQHNRRR